MLTKVLNEGQKATNLLKVQEKNACCGAPEGLCAYEITHTEANAPVSITIQEDGVNRVLPLPSGATTAALVKAGIISTLKAVGYEDDGSNIKGVTVVDAGSTHTVTIIGYIKVVSIITGSGTESATAKCTSYGSVTYTARIGSATTPAVTYNGASSTIISLVYGTTTTSAVDTAVTNALTALGITASVTVTDDSAVSKYKIEFDAPQDGHYTIGGIEFVPSNLKRTWKA